MSPPNPPRTPQKTALEQSIETALERVLPVVLKPIVDRLDKLEKVDEGVNETLGKVNERLTAKSGAYKDILGTVQKTSDSVVDVDERQDTLEGRVERIDSRVERIETKMDTQLRQAGVAQGIIQTVAKDVAKTTELSEGREGDFLIAQTKSKLAFEEMKSRVFWGAVVAIVLGVVTTVTNAVVTLKRSDAIEQHVDERIKTTNERLDRALPK